MKNILCIIIISFCFLTNIEAKEIVTLEKCVDGDTAWFNLENKKIKVRFLAIDTPESTKEVERYGKEASIYTCNKLKEASKIEIEYDENSDKFDKYDRHLAWVFVDNELLQNLIIKEGLGKVEYIYGDYKYTDILKASEILAKSNKIGIWSDNNYNFYVIIGFVILIITIIVCLLNKKIRNKVLKKIKIKAKSKLKRYVKI